RYFEGGVVLSVLYIWEEGFGGKLKEGNMFCVCSVSKPTVGSGNIPEITDSDSNSLPTKRFSSRNRVPSEPPKPSVMQMQRIVGAGSFRDTEPLPLPYLIVMNRGSDMRKTVMDLFLGQAMEGRVQKKMRETGEWLDANAESKITSSSTFSFHSSILISN
ncbi:hypothetical protein V8G54_020243, partial [Vigna mungo]